MRFAKTAAASLSSLSRRMAVDRRGNVAVLVALSLPVLVGFAGLGLETGVWYKTKRVAQNSADAAAISGAIERAKNNSLGMTTTATAEAVRNGWSNAASSTFALNNPPSSGPNAGVAQAVEVRLSMQQPALFSRLIRTDATTIGARAVATLKENGDACILALDPTAQSALQIQGSTTVNVNGCIVASNSKHARSIDVTGNGYLNAKSMWSAGGHNVGNSSQLILETPPVDYAWPLADPYAGLSNPSPGACTVNLGNGNGQVSYTGTYTLSPGVYCGDLNIGSQDVVTFNAGTYYIDRGNLTVNAGARLSCNCTATGSGVTFVLTSTGSANQIGTVTINGGGTITLQAPSVSTPDSTYPYPGMLFYQDRRAASNGSNKFNGNSGMNLGGAIYFPSQEVQWSGNDTTSGPSCTQIVARLVTFIGNSTLNNSGCGAAGVSRVVANIVSLIE
jgi:Flp pilus assembly protein TadG